MPRRIGRFRRETTNVQPTTTTPSPCRHQQPPQPPVPANATVTNTDEVNVQMQRRFLNDGVNLNRGTAHLERTVNQFNQTLKPKSVTNVYEGKKLEYMQYCECVYPNDPYKYHLNNNKAYNFIFYQVMRNKKKVGGRKEKNIMNGQKVYFDHDDYKNVHNIHSSHDPYSGIEPPEPDDPVGYNQIEHYRTIIKQIFKDQKQQGTNGNTWDDVWMDNLENLLRMAKRRRAVKKKRNYEEKVTAEMIPYSTVERYPDIEKVMWMRGQQNGRTAVAYIRHRFCLLFTTGGILRCESLFNAELSDFLGVTVQSGRDPHPLNILIMQFGTGTSHVTNVVNYFFFIFDDSPVYLTILHDNFLLTKTRYDVKI